MPRLVKTKREARTIALNEGGFQSPGGRIRLRANGASQIRNQVKWAIAMMSRMDSYGFSSPTSGGLALV
jgi:hypothetical protein